MLMKENMIADSLAESELATPRPQRSRLGRWITLSDELSSALLEAAREALTNGGSALDRIDAMKEIVTVGHRLFALERVLADTPRLAGDGALGVNQALVAQRLEEFLQVARTQRPNETPQDERHVSDQDMALSDVSEMCGYETSSRGAAEGE